ncbi:MAG TPA: type I secretion C-terminal target domain-containing protein [Rhodopila sp.]|jgi:hypothetical protein
MSSQTWNGQDLSFAYAYPTSDSTYEYQTIVADGTTYQEATGSFSFSVSYVSSNVEQIEISNFTDAYGSYFPAAANNGPVFFGPGGDTPIIGATLVSTNMAGLTQSDVSYSSTSVGVNWENLNDYPNTYITIDVTFGSSSPPTLTSVAPAVVEQGQTTVIGTVSPGGSGDTLSLTQTGGNGTLSLITVNGIQEVVYQAPAHVASDAVDMVSYTVYDQQLATLVTGTASVQLDAGPSITAAVPSAVEKGQTTVIGTVTPGLPGDTITLSQAPGSLGIVSLGSVLANGTQQVIYTAPTSVPANAMDAVSYTVTDQHHDAVASGTASVQLDADKTTVYLQGYFNTVSAPATAPKGTTTTGAPITGPIFGFATLNGTSASQTITAYGYDNTINANGGNDVIYAGLGLATVTVSNGNGNNTISGAQGNTSVTLGNGNNTISLGGYFDTVTLGNGNNTITGPQGNAQVTVGSGSNVVTLGGYLNAVHAGSTTGTDYINAGIGYETVTGGNGNFVVLAGGYGNMVTLGNGNNDVFTSPTGSNPSLPNGSAVPAEQGLATVTTGSGNDTIILGGFGNTVSAGGGMNFIRGGLGLDTFVLSNPGFDEIAGFSTTNGDTLNVAAALQAAGWNFAPATLGNYLKVTDANNNATISVFKGGSGTGVAIAQLDGVGNLTLSTLQNHMIL